MVSVMKSERATLFKLETPLKVPVDLKESASQRGQSLTVKWLQSLPSIANGAQSAKREINGQEFSPSNFK